MKSIKFVDFWPSLKAKKDPLFGLILKELFSLDSNSRMVNDFFGRSKTS